MAAQAVEPTYVEMTATLSVTVTVTLFLVTNSLLSFNLEENGSMKILRASYSLNGISKLKDKRGARTLNNNFNVGNRAIN